MSIHINLGYNGRSFFTGLQRSLIKNGVNAVINIVNFGFRNPPVVEFILPGPLSILYIVIVVVEMNNILGSIVAAIQNGGNCNGSPNPSIVFAGVGDGGFLLDLHTRDKRFSLLEGLVQFDCHITNGEYICRTVTVGQVGQGAPD